MYCNAKATITIVLRTYYTLVPGTSSILVTYLIYLLYCMLSYKLQKYLVYDFAFASLSVALSLRYRYERQAHT